LSPWTEKRILVINKGAVTKQPKRKEKIPIIEKDGRDFSVGNGDFL
jgi:hypothetical protein